jgi:hypothetical protein
MSASTAASLKRNYCDGGRRIESLGFQRIAAKRLAALHPLNGVVDQFDGCAEMKLFLDVGGWISIVLTLR